MKRIELHPALDGYSWREREVEQPRPGAGEVLLRVLAVSLNYRDRVIRDFVPLGDKTKGVVPLSDGVGEVVACGEGAAVPLGQRVCGTFFSHWLDGRFQAAYHDTALGGSAHGMLAEYVVLPAHGVVPAPLHMTDEEAACLPCAGVTTWHALMDRGGLQPGDTVLALGTGGVSIFALQIARAMGARVLITSSSEEKLARARSLGADDLINYRQTPNWQKEVFRLTEKRGVDHVIEVGGPGTLARSLQCVAAGGHVANIGVLTGFDAPDGSLFPLVQKNATMTGIYVGSRNHFQRMNAFLSASRLHPVIDRTFPFAEYEAAYQYFLSGQHFGKVTIRIAYR
jgi:NADPH:quinone reductase-like Zn-dependent oxidoreductase